MKKIAKAVIDYLKDWKNLLFHGAVGVAILAIAFFIPVPTHARIALLVLVVVFNVLRGRLFPAKPSN